ncbi:bifunctional transcriptional activator/DNA repair enzyme AdaA [Actibacterium sp. 188UL27-1]|uniref:bifunctional transcriptional activator/DNA repair enzyme AdaA n=1 Tax=Actibacterium sp. 188UL27-1 TaxID=2786961 RepID=UPI0019572295|nr:trifunctional transcriptional activator/DNA repair protein Ada/methylated-DNA--[protein]-cysteine S-methyltransferase [Actibacterium sp. 188UL27-1]MBM7069198.1 bifunctional transcriptional activator/DNA repair protein Ada [Actibacterium sp. 188UL27-1]
MLFVLPSDDTLYQALLDRDPSYDGRAYVGVTTTGVFCRLTCPARKPKRENSVFHETVAACMEAGFRPCKRCQPLAVSDQPVVTDLIGALQENPAHRWREGDIAARGHDPSTVRRVFKRQFGMTFLDMARLTRLRLGAEALTEGGRVIDAQLDAGFSSASGFRAAFAQMLGVPPGSLRDDAMLKADWIDTPLGAMIAVSDRHALHVLEFHGRKALRTELATLQTRNRTKIGVGRFGPTDQIAGELEAYFAGRSAAFDTPLALSGTPFNRTVWDALRQIPAGQTCSYAELAQAIGQPTATRAVARANGANQIAIVIPCHRVIGTDGTLTGYGGGLWRKRWLNDHERTFTTQKAP